MAKWSHDRIEVIVAAVALVAVLYHFYYIMSVAIGPTQHQILHLGFVLILVGLITQKEKPWQRRFWTLIIIMSVVCVVYLFINYEQLEIRAGHPTPADEIIGWLLVIVVIITTWVSFGKVLPILSIAAILYMFFCSYMPGALRGPELEHGKVITYLAMGFRGIFEILLSVSAKYIFAFIVFGAMLTMTGAGNFFREVGKLVGRYLAGGSAISAVVSSGLVGMVTGAPAANVAVTGIFTIPAMKSEGRNPEESAAFEACASTGGAILPPVMGATAFIMMGLLGTTYAHICFIAAIPAALYYFILLLQAQITGMKLNLAKSQQEVDFRVMLTFAPTFIIPLFVLIAFLVLEFSAMYAVFWAVTILLAISLLQKQTRPNFSKFIDACKSGSQMAAKIGVACACIGMLASCLQVTQLGLRLPELIEIVSFGIIPIALIFAAIVAVILGAGMPGMAVYIIVAITVVPVLVQIGINKEAAHMFSLYFSVFSAITPPVALATMVAARIAGADYMEAGLKGVRIGIVAFTVPFVFIFRPELLLSGNSVVQTVFYILLTALAYYMLAAFLNNYGLFKLGLKGLSLSGVSALGIFIFLFTEANTPLIIGLVFTALFFSWQLWEKAHRKKLVASKR
ncbi:TRAP transporter permease [Thermodesulfobacteriota bacterium]